MHETGVCRSIVETVEEHAIANHAKRVIEVRIKLGEIHDIVPEILCGAFEWMCRGTVAEGAKMVIERVPFTVECEGCGHVYRLNASDESTWDCPKCGERRYHLHTGREFSIESIEVEGFSAGEKDTTAEAAAKLAASRQPRDVSSLAVSGRRAAPDPRVREVA